MVATCGVCSLPQNVATKEILHSFQSLDNASRAQLHLDFIEFVPRLVDVAGEPYREDVW